MKKLSLLFLFFIGFHSSVSGENNFLKESNKNHRHLLEKEVAVCGNRNISTGKKFYENFFQGDPEKGIFIVNPVSPWDLKKIIRKTSYESLNKEIKKLFSKMEILVIERAGEIKRLANSEMKISVPRKLHKCLQTDKNKWGCGVSIPGEVECCEKRLGSPVIILSFEARLNNEKFILFYRHGIGETRLVRSVGEKEKYIYYCINSEPLKFLYYFNSF